MDNDDSSSSFREIYMWPLTSATNCYTGCRRQRLSSRLRSSRSSTTSEADEPLLTPLDNPSRIGPVADTVSNPRQQQRHQQHGEEQAASSCFSCCATERHTIGVHIMEDDDGNKNVGRNNDNVGSSDSRVTEATAAATTQSVPLSLLEKKGKGKNPMALLSWREVLGGEDHDDNDDGSALPLPPLPTMKCIGYDAVDSWEVLALLDPLSVVSKQQDRKQQQQQHAAANSSEGVSDDTTVQTTGEITTTTTTSTVSSSSNTNTTIASNNNNFNNSNANNTVTGSRHVRQHSSSASISLDGGSSSDIGASNANAALPIPGLHRRSSSNISMESIAAVAAASSSGPPLAPSSVSASSAAPFSVTTSSPELEEPNNSNNNNLVGRVPPPSRSSPSSARALLLLRNTLTSEEYATTLDFRPLAPTLGLIFTASTSSSSFVDREEKEKGGDATSSSAAKIASTTTACPIVWLGSADFARLYCFVPSLPPASPSTPPTSVDAPQHRRHPAAALMEVPLKNDAFHFSTPAMALDFCVMPDSAPSSCTCFCCLAAACQDGTVRLITFEAANSWFDLPIYTNVREESVVVDGPIACVQIRECNADTNSNSGLKSVQDVGLHVVFGSLSGYVAEFHLRRQRQQQKVSKERTAADGNESVSLNDQDSTPRQMIQGQQQEGMNTDQYDEPPDQEVQPCTKESKQEEKPEKENSKIQGSKQEETQSQPSAEVETSENDCATDKKSNTDDGQDSNANEDCSPGQQHEGTGIESLSKESKERNHDLRHQLVKDQLLQASAEADHEVSSDHQISKQDEQLKKKEQIPQEGTGEDLLTNEEQNNEEGLQNVQQGLENSQHTSSSAQQGSKKEETPLLLLPESEADQNYPITEQTNQADHRRGLGGDSVCGEPSIDKKSKQAGRKQQKNTDVDGTVLSSGAFTVKWDGPSLVAEGLWNSSLKSADSALAVHSWGNLVAVGTYLGRVLVYRRRDENRRNKNDDFKPSISISRTAADNYTLQWSCQLPYSIHGICHIRNHSNKESMKLLITTRRSIHIFEDAKYRPYSPALALQRLMAVLQKHGVSLSEEKDG